MRKSQFPYCALAAAFGLGAVLAAQGATAQSIPNVSREETLISGGWDQYTQVPAQDNFNPYAGVVLHQRNSLHYTVYESLFYTNHNTNEIIPWLAEKFEYNQDFTEVTVKLRDGVTWSDGKPFTADDVVFTFDMLRQAAPKMLLSSVVVEWVKSATAVDPLTISIKLNKPGPRWAADFLATGQSTRFVVVPKHIWEGKDPLTFKNLDIAQGWPVGTGPFKLVEVSPRAVIFDRRDSWWAVDRHVRPALPEVKRVIYAPASGEATPQLFASNQLDMGFSIQPGTYEAIRVQNPNLISWNKEGPVWGAPDGCTFTLRFNTQKAPFDNADFRRAINAALDRDKIVNIAYEGATKPATLPLSSYQSMAAYLEPLNALPEVAALNQHSQELVDASMAKAGFKKNSQGKWETSQGAPLQFTIVVNQGEPSAPILQQQLQAAGFDVVISAQQVASRLDAEVSGNFQVSIGTHCGSLYDPWQTLEHFHSKYAAPAGTPVKNARAITRYSNKELDALLDQMEKSKPSPDDPAYLELAEKAASIFAKDLPEIVFAEETHTLVFNSTYWTGFPSATDPYVAPYMPWEGFALIVDNLKANKK